MSAAEPELDPFTLARAKRGDAGASRALVVRYERPVFAVLSRVLGARHAPQVEDLAQETFLRVFRELARFDLAGPARLSTWILTIATRLAIDELRRQSHRQHDAVPEEHAGALETDAYARQRGAAGLVERALAEMPDEYRATFILRAYHDLSHEEIAAALQAEVGTVKSRLARAKARILAAVEGRESA